MKVGDLVEVEKWCLNKFRKAIVVHVEVRDPDVVWIKYLDGRTGTNETGYVLRDNLKVLSESR